MKKEYFSPDSEVLQFRVQSDCLITSMPDAVIEEAEEEEWLVN